MQRIWLFWATFGCIQKNISYLTDNFPKQGYKVLFFPLPRCNYVKITQIFWLFLMNFSKDNFINNTIWILEFSTDVVYESPLAFFRNHFHSFFVFQEKSHLNQQSIKLINCVWSQIIAILCNQTLNRSI